jgi:CDP-glucose 4,6-dehydratase
MVKRRDFWTRRRVFLTGHTGFKGSWLALWLRSLGADVAGFALPPQTDPSLFVVARVADGIISQTGDIAARAALTVAIAKHRPEVIFHLAAQALVRDSYRDPVGTFATNIMGTIHLLEAARTTSGVRAIVVATSDKCYENRGLSRGYREDDPMGGRDPYSASKGAAELVTAAYRHSFFSKPEAAHVATVRAGNVIGGGDWAEDRLVPDIVRAAKQGQPVRLRYPSAVRPWQHVLDALNGYLMVAERLSRQDGSDYARGWNFGPPAEDALPVHNVATRLCQKLGVDSSWIEAGGPLPHEAQALTLDSASARDRLGWLPRFSLDESIDLVGEWYRAFDAGKDMRRITQEQIDHFSARSDVPAHA